jgi:hypothetical protein
VAPAPPLRLRLPRRPAPPWDRAAAEAIYSGLPAASPSDKDVGMGRTNPPWVVAVTQQAQSASGHDGADVLCSEPGSAVRVLQDRNPPPHPVACGRVHLQGGTSAAREQDPWPAIRFVDPPAHGGKSAWTNLAAATPLQLTVVGGEQEGANKTAAPPTQDSLEQSDDERDDETEPMQRR